MKLISIVVAVYQNEGSLSIMHEQIQRLFQDKLFNYSYEIIFVNDGSSDGSLDELMKLHKLDANVKVISFTRNFGQQPAMIAGFKETKGDAIVNISADLQDPIPLIADMVKLWEDGVDVAIGYRIGRSDPLLAKIVSKIAYAVLRLSNPGIPKGGFDYVLMGRRVMDDFNSIDVRHRFFQGDLLWLGYKVGLLPYFRMERKIGKSQYTFIKKFNNFYDAVLDSSYLPIRAISFIGFATSVLGFVYAILILINWFRGNTPFMGWAPIMMIILIISGLIMVMLGILGEYIWRINSEVRKKPNYIIDKKFF